MFRFPLLRSSCCTATRFTVPSSFALSSSSAKFITSSIAAAPCNSSSIRSFHSGGGVGIKSGDGGTSGNPMAVDFKNFVAYTEIDLPMPTRIQHIRSKHMHKGGHHEWIAMEKVHGTNFGCYLLDEHNIKYAKRSGIMQDSENFFGYHVMKDDFSRWIRTILRLIKEKYGLEDERIGTVIMNGELFGAKYDHPKVKKSEKVAIYHSAKGAEMRQPIRQVLIQEEEFPQYSPELHYFCFDLKYSIRGALPDMMDKPKIGGGGAEQYSDLRLLPYDDFLEICEACVQEHPDFIYAKPLVRGTLDECLTFDVENFETPLPAQLGLGDFKLNNNLAEGVVIKHVLRGDPAFDRNAEAQGVATILKLRSSHFMELKHAGKAAEMRNDFQEIRRRALQETGGKEKTLEAAAVMPEFQAKANELLINHVSEGRLSNVVSKIGKQVLIDGKVSQEELALRLAKDALKDFLKDIEDPDNVLLSSPLMIKEMFNKNCYLESLEVVKEKWAELTKPQSFVDDE